MQNGNFVCLVGRTRIEGAVENVWTYGIRSKRRVEKSTVRRF
jgi:hypothetical protein